MFSPVKSIIRQVTPRKTLNILCGTTHERYTEGLCLTGHNFYSYQDPERHIKPWNYNYAQPPSNYHLLPEKIIPAWIDFDLVLSQHKYGQFQTLAQIARQMHLPIVNLEHTLPHPGFPESEIRAKGEMRADINVFISEYSIDKWLWKDYNDTEVVHHMVDTDTFRSSDQERRNHILSVVNDWKNRDVFCNYKGWERITKDLPTHVRGDNPGLSTPTSSVSELVSEYQTSRIFLNTSTVSPIPTSLLESMSCGCAPVSMATCMIPEIIEHGVNGFISNSEDELRSYCKTLLADEDLARKIGENARKTILEKFHKDKFVSRWNDIFYKASKIPFLG